MTEQTRVIEIELPTKLTIGGPANRDAELSTAKWSADFLIEAALHGLKQRRSDKFSVTKSADGLDKAIEQLAELDKAIEAGTIRASATGTRGTSQSIETKGWIAYFHALKHKEGGKVVNGGNLDRAKESYVRQVLLQHPDLPDAVEHITEYVEEYKDQVLEAAEQDTSKGTPGWYIKEERKSREVKPTTAPLPSLKLKPKQPE